MMDMRTPKARIKDGASDPTHRLPFMADQGQRHCIFCGSIADDREHLLPEWIQKILPSDEPVVHIRQVGGVDVPRWEKKPFREKAKIVCQGCNHGWMSDLENESKPLLASAIAREGRCEFDLVSQWTVARWAVKTCYVFQRLAPALLAPQMHPVLLRMNLMPPQPVSVWMGSHYRAREDPINSAYVQKPLTLAIDQQPKESAEFGYMGFLAVGGAAFLVVGHRLSNYVECVLGEDHPASQMFTKIWPRSRRVVSWPPYLMADRELIDLIFDPDTLPLGFDARVFPGRYHEAPFRDAY